MPTSNHSPWESISDLGDLALAAAAFVQQRHQTVTTWELFLTSQPVGWNYLLFAGLSTLLERLQAYHLTTEQIEYLRCHPAFASIPLAWLDHLSSLRFTGDVWAMPEGTVCFAPSPVLRITAPFDVAALVGSLVKGTLLHQIQVASKVSRMMTAAEGRMLIDQSVVSSSELTQAQSTTRAAYLAGILSTTHTEAARQLQLPSHVLMPAAWPMLFQNEVEAFHRFGQSFNTMHVPVVDIMDAMKGIKHAIASGAPMQAVHLEAAGDLVELSLEARRMLDQNKRKHVKILFSGDLDEEAIAKLVHRRAAVDGFVVNASKVKSADGASVRGVYKLVAHHHPPEPMLPAYQMSAARRSYPWAKQVHRQTNDDGSFAGDIIARESEGYKGEKLLVPMMKQGVLVAKLPSLEEARDYCMMQRIRLPVELLALTPAKQMYPIRYSDALEQEMSRLVARHRV